MSAAGAFSAFLDAVNEDVATQPLDEVSARKSARAAAPARKSAASKTAARKTSTRKTAARKSA